MRMGALSEKSGVSVPSIKYYIREGLLDPGRLTGPNQADYGDEHLRRLALIRALREVGGLSIATIKEVLEAASGTTLGTVTAIGRAMDALAGEAGRDEGADELARRIRTRLEKEGWHFRADAGALSMLARAMIGGSEAFGRTADPEDLMRYAEPVMEIARREFAAGERTENADWGEEEIAWAMLGTVMLEPVILALRRLAHEHLALARVPEAARRPILEREAARDSGADAG